LVFSSYLFLFVFLPGALALYFAAPRRARHLVLTAVSYLFYGWGQPAYCVLLLFSTAIDWACGLAVAGARPFERQEIARLDPAVPRTRLQRLALTCSIVSNLALLAFFKYHGFAVESWNSAAAALGLQEAVLASALRVALPLGISFYTFQSMSYTIDVWRGRARAIRSFVDFACYVSMFPQLVAGPIVRFSEIADQLEERTHTLAKCARGAAFFSLGLAKKVLLANPCGRIADAVFDAGQPAVLDAWQGLVAYAFQIYFDFSGYSDMAIGLGLVLGFAFPKNFDSPYRAESITDFWRRWHISLSTWLRDYLYVPLGGNRHGAARTYANLSITMLLGGLWHGASWNFVCWGGLHGALLALERGAAARQPLAAWPRPVRVAATFLVVLLTWVPFRAETFAATASYYAALFGLSAPDSASRLLPGLIRGPYLMATLAAAAIVVWLGPQSWTWTRNLTAWRIALSLLLIATSIALLATQDFNPFIYFIF